MQILCALAYRSYASDASGPIVSISTGTIGAHSRICLLVLSTSTLILSVIDREGQVE
ncbi:protein of unknown function [Candidatus Nitrospira inopinata]|uniref:Uncharacterized protein n=1 Tax=Candidatus Nitrospira inopinata TaxID=1715989 RepID=A0A0S4KXX4_9BACT|nr:protein of unknown function [Candidatus Nitrospira inopinata]